MTGSQGGWPVGIPVVSISITYELVWRFTDLARFLHIRVRRGQFEITRSQAYRTAASIQQPAFGVKRMPLYTAITKDGFVFDKTKAKIAKLWT
jgi:hypothetical protein